MTSTEGLHEPDRFGPWLKGQPLPPPVPGQSLAWLCQKQGSDEQALVELHFGGAGLGLQLREAVAANATLAQLGAERLIQTDRLILRSSEGWTDPPGGTFQYWVAREITQTAASEPLAGALLRQTATSLQALAAAVSQTRLTFSPAPNDFSLTPDGSVRVARIGLPTRTPDQDPGAALLAFLRAQPLDDQARTIVEGASSSSDLLGASLISSTPPTPDQTSTKKDAGADLTTTIEDRVQQAGPEEIKQRPAPAPNADARQPIPSVEQDLEPSEPAKPTEGVRPPVSSSRDAQVSSSADPRTARLCAALVNLGVQAQIADRSWVRKNLPSWLQELPAVIEIEEGPIKWANLSQGDTTSSTAEPSVSYGIPDPRIGSSFPQVEIHSVRVRDFPMLGKVFNVSWSGYDAELGLLSRLNSDASARQPVQVLGDLQISSHAEDACWLLTDPTGDQNPSSELWDLYQTLARHLLALPLDTVSGPEISKPQNVTDRQPRERSEAGDQVALSHATAPFDRAIAHDPNDAEAYYNRANQFQDFDETDRAIADYGKVIALDPNNADAYYNRATLYDHQGDRQRAIADYDQALMINPNDAHAYYSRGALHHSMGQQQWAISDLKAALANTDDPGLTTEIRALLRQVR